MEDDLIRSDASLEARKTGPDEFQATVQLPVDEDGMLARECGVEECSPGYFKVHTETDESLQEGGLHCPYCGAADAFDEFATTEQVDYVTALVERNAMEGIERMITKSLGLGPSGKKTIGGGMLSVEMSLKAPKRAAPLPPQEEALRRDVACPKCHLRHAVFGLAVWCPGCGADVFLTHLEAELAVLVACLEAAPARRAELGARVAAKDLENVLEDLVSTFEAAMKFIARRHLLAGGLSEDEVAGRLEKEIRSAFQSASRGAEVAKAELGLELFDGQDEKDVVFFEAVFEKRHPVTHNLGVIDRKYLKKARSGELPGREIRVTKEELSYAIGLVRTTLTRAFLALFPDGITPYQPDSGSRPRPTLAHGTGLSDAAFEVASVLARESKQGDRFECLDLPELVDKTGLSQPDLEEAVDELIEANLVNDDWWNRSSHRRAAPTMRLFYKLDPVVMGWDPKEDALELVKLIAEVDENGGIEPPKLAEMLGWDIRRTNPACMYVDEMGWAKAYKIASGSHYEVGQFCPTPKTRRVAKGQVK